MFDPAEASRQIKREFIDYITTSDRFADARMRESFRRNLESQLSKGPIVDIKDSFRPTKSIEELINEGILSPEFREMEAGKPAAHGGLYSRKLPLTRPLYAHQEHAVRRIGSGHSAIVTTGTGSGKTECFLIPILNELLTQAHEGSLPESGVQAILIYPMNALANDQMKRLRELLLCYPQIRFGVYSGDTKESQADALKRYRELHINDRYDETRTAPIPNEIISREEMRKNPPHILCTNYAMLERLLLRPQDEDLFAKSDIRFVVLDEAHVYHGATGMETAFLLRRLKARIASKGKTRFILTSATLGTQGKSDQQILDFGRNLTGETYEMDDIIYGQRVQHQFEETRDIPITFFERIASRDTDDEALTGEELKKICTDFELPYRNDADAAENLFDICYSSSYYQIMRNRVHDPIDLNTFAELLGLQPLQAIQFLHVLTQAYKNGVAIVDVRYHFFMRALEGAYYAPGADDGQVWLTRRSSVTRDGVDYAAFEIAVCADCGKTAIVGQIGDPDENGICHVEPVAQYEKDKIRYLFFGSTSIGEEIEADELSDEAEKSKKEIKTKKNGAKIISYRLCTQCGSITDAEDGNPNCCCEGKQFITVFGYDEAKRHCACCGTGRMLRVFLPNHLATAVLGTSLFETLKPRMITEYVDGVARTREGGRQFLAFSDSRSEAAFFAPCLSQYYGDFLRRRGIANLAEQMLQEVSQDSFAYYSAADLAFDLKRLFIENGTFNESLSVNVASPREKDRIAERHAWMAVLGAMLSSESRDSLTSFGFLQFVFRPHYAHNNGEDLIAKYANQYHTDYAKMEGLLNGLLATTVAAGALTFKGKDAILSPDDKKYVFFSERDREIIEVATEKSRTNQIGWLPRNMAGKADKFYKNARMSMVMRALGLGEVEAVSFLQAYFKWLEPVLEKHFRHAGMTATNQLPLELFDVLFPGHPKAQWYRCSRCGRVTTHKWGDCCVSANCTGTLEAVSPAELQQANHYVNLYRKPLLKPMIIKEHTAQLSRSEGAKFQDDFEKNNINALSCSTTFEMGVDVGDLETVFLRDVPPSAANYAQRAGRAGRSKHAAAYALTYAKLSSHDFTFFDQPNKLIAGTIQPPVFKLYNEKILNRHIYAVVLAYLFHKDPACYGDGRMQTFLDSKGDQKLRDLIAGQPAGLTELLKQTFASAGSEVQNYAVSYCWTDGFVGEEGVLTATVGEYTGTLKSYKDEIARLWREQKNSERRRILERQEELYQKERLIDMFSRHNVLPRYGFPVDTAELTPVQDAAKETNAFGSESGTLQMQRDLKMAISEYAPGARVIAGGAMYTSRYVRKAFMGRGESNDFHRGFVYYCDHCDTWNFNQVKKDCDQKCIKCGRPLDNIKAWESSIEPREGFFTAFDVQKVPRERPSHSYANQAAYIGDGRKLAVYRYSVGDHIVTLSSSSKDKIMITSQRPFYICHRCGYGLGASDTVKNKNGSSTNKDATKDLRDGYKATIEVEHETARHTPCECTTLHRERFHHIFETDVVTIGFDRYCPDEKMQYSVTNALLRAMVDVLDIEETEIAACPGFSREGLSMFLYDTAAGGAGHVHRLLKQETLQRVLERALQIVNNCTCDSSCYSCLRNYGNQRIHEQLDRHLAADYLASYAGVCCGWEQCGNDQDESSIKPVIVLQDGVKYVGTYHELFEELEEEVDDDDTLILKRLASEADQMEGAPASYSGMLIRIGEDGEEFPPLMYWPEQKVMLTYHLTDDAAASLAADGWTVIPLDQNTTCGHILNAIGGKASWQE